MLIILIQSGPKVGIQRLDAILYTVYQLLAHSVHAPGIFYYLVLWPTNAELFHKLSHSYMFQYYPVILRELVILVYLARYSLQAPWGWHNSVKTCRSAIICEIIVHLLVTAQNSQVLSGNYTAVKQQTLETVQWGFQSPLDELATGTGLWPPHSADMNKCFITGMTYSRSLQEKTHSLWRIHRTKFVTLLQKNSKVHNKVFPLWQFTPHCACSITKVSCIQSKHTNLFNIQNQLHVSANIWCAQVKVGLLNLCKDLFSLNVHEE